MLPARKNALFNFALRRLLARALRRRFHAVRVAGAERLGALDSNRPTIGCVNHTNWWDGFVLYALSHRMIPERDIYLAMEEKNLRRYPFFRWMGCFGVDLETLRAALPAVRYALRLLAGKPRRLAWFFVQGKLVLPSAPIVAKPGAAWIAQRSGAQLLPLVIRYAWLAESRPSIFVRIGAPMSPDVGDDTLSDRLNALTREVDGALESPELREGYAPLFPSRLSMNKRWDFFVHRLRGRERGTFEREN